MIPKSKLAIIKSLSLSSRSNIFCHSFYIFQTYVRGEGLFFLQPPKPLWIALRKERPFVQDAKVTCPSSKSWNQCVLFRWQVPQQPSLCTKKSRISKEASLRFYTTKTASPSVWHTIPVDVWFKKALKKGCSKLHPPFVDLLHILPNERISKNVGFGS